MGAAGLAIDASTPAVKANSSGSPVSNSVVSPPANSLFALFFGNPIDQAVTISSIAGGTGLTWVKWIAQLGNNATAEAWWAYGSPATFTATLTMSGTLTALSGGYMVSVIVFTGANSSQAASHVKGTNAIGALPSAALTAAAADSWVIGSVTNGGNATGPTVPASQTTTLGGHSQIVTDAVDGFAAWVQANTAAGNSNLTINDTAPSTLNDTIAVEILAAPAAAASSVFPVFLPRVTLGRGVRNLGQIAAFLQRVPTVVVTGPAVLAASTSDTSLSTTVCTRVLALPRATTDSSASTDAVTRVETQPRATADTSLSSDALTRGALTLPRATADTSLSTEATTRVEVQARSTADASASSDSATRVLRLARTLADTSLSATTATRVLFLPRSTADTSLTSDVATGSTAAHFTRSTADTSLSSDAVTTVSRFPRSESDTSTSSDAVTRALALPRATSDTSLSSDATSRIAHLFRSTADTSLSSDQATHGTIPQPPRITPPTTASILAYHSAAAIRAYSAHAAIAAYSATGQVTAYLSDGDLADYVTSPAIVAYTSRATVVTYSSNARIGPTLG